MLSILITSIASLFFLIGYLITKFVNNKEKLYNFSLGIAFSALLYIVLLDVIPEVFEIFNPLKNKYLIMIILALCGFFIFYFLDAMIPDHHHKHKEKNDNKIEHYGHKSHIGVITAIAVIIHNLVEGTSIFIVANNNIKAGILMSIAVGIHNIPFGIEVFASSKKNIKNIFLNILLVMSTTIGGLIVFIFNNSFNEIILGCLLVLTVGMCIYIIFMELLKELIHNQNKKVSFAGIIMGIIIMILSSLI